MTKVACNQCGALILPGTAAETDGLCMACKQGIRASLEASRDYYRKLKEYDPYRELWTWLVGEAQRDPSLGSMSLANRHYFAVCLLEGEVYNGGFDQFFSNSSGAYYAHAVAGLQALEAEISLTVLQDAATLLFGTQPPPVDREERWDAMGRAVGAQVRQNGGGDVSSKLEAQDRLFWADPDQLSERLPAFAQSSGILIPYEKRGPTD